MSEVYQPAEDSILLMQNIESEEGNSALDIGTGSGIIASKLQENFRFVVATDISFDSLVLAKQKIDNIVCCNAGDSILYTFDLIVCNMPYLPSVKHPTDMESDFCDELEDKAFTKSQDGISFSNYGKETNTLDRAVDGGIEGIEIQISIVESARNLISQNGKFVFVTSTLSNYEKLLLTASEIGFDTRIVESKPLFFEKLLVVEAIRR